MVPFGWLTTVVRFHDAFSIALVLACVFQEAQAEFGPGGWRRTVIDSADEGPSTFRTLGVVPLMFSQEFFECLMEQY